MDINIIYNKLQSIQGSSHPEEEILKFLCLMGEILSSNFTEGYSFSEYFPTDRGASNSGVKEYWNKTEIREIILSEKRIMNYIPMLVDAILHYIKKQVDDYINENFMQALHYSTVISKFIKITTTLNINVKFATFRHLDSLFKHLRRVNGEDLLERGPWFQIVAKAIGNFKEIKFAQNRILKTINKTLAKVKREIVKFPETICHESLLLNLTILKEVLQYRRLQLLTFEEDDYDNEPVLAVTKNYISALMNKFPEYIRVLMQDCASLI